MVNHGGQYNNNTFIETQQNRSTTICRGPPSFSKGAVKANDDAIARMWAT
jgi:hypothetical protein